MTVKITDAEIPVGAVKEYEPTEHRSTVDRLNAARGKAVKIVAKDEAEAKSVVALMRKDCAHLNLSLRTKWEDKHVVRVWVLDKINRPKAQPAEAE